MGELFSAEIIQEEEDDIAMSPQKSNYVIQYLPIGLCLGAALGVVIQNISMGIFIGVGIGVFIDFLKNKKKIKFVFSLTEAISMKVVLSTTFIGWYAKRVRITSRQT